MLSATIGMRCEHWHRILDKLRWHPIEETLSDCTEDRTENRTENRMKNRMENRSENRTEDCTRNRKIYRCFIYLENLIERRTVCRFASPFASEIPPFARQFAGLSNVVRVRLSLQSLQFECTIWTLLCTFISARASLNLFKASIRPKHQPGSSFNPAKASIRLKSQTGSSFILR